MLYIHNVGDADSCC